MTIVAHDSTGHHSEMIEQVGLYSGGVFGSNLNGVAEYPD